MKKYQLSTAAERTAGILFSVIMIAVLIVLLFALKDNLTVLLLTASGVVLVVGILVLYVLNVSKAACVASSMTPVASRPLSRWNAASAASVPLIKLPEI